MAETVARSMKGTLAVVGIFALGVVFGVALCFVIVHHGGRLGPPRSHGGGAGLHERIMKQLDLDAAQREKVQPILDRGHQRMREVLDETRREIRAELRPDQQEKLDQIHPPGALK